MSETNEFLITPEFRAAFVRVFEPRETDKGDRYEVVMIFDKGTDITALKQAAAKAARDKWGDAAAKMKLESPFTDGANKVDQEGNLYDGFGPGQTCVTAWSKFAPGLVDENLQPIIDPTAFYSGCYARAQVRAFAWDYEGKKRGVSFSLDNLQKMKDGPALGFKRPKAEEVFSVIEGAAAPAAEAGDPLFW